MIGFIYLIIGATLLYMVYYGKLPYLKYIISGAAGDKPPGT